MRGLRRVGGLAAGLLACALFGAVHARRAERRHGPRGGFLPGHGGLIHFVQAGSGPDVVLIHGTAVTLDDMRAGPLDLLARRFRVTAFDRPGHGHSDPSREASAESQAARIHEAIQALELVQPVIVGHSLGGAVALAYALQWPDEISGVVAIAPLAYPDWTAVHFAAALHAAPVLGGLLSYSLLAVTDALIAPLASRFAFAPRAPTDRFRAMFPISLTTRPRSTRQDGRDVMAVTRSLFRLQRLYPQIRTPVDLFVGANDLVISPRRHACRLARTLGERARLTVLDGQGHMAHHFCGPQLLKAVERMAPGATMPL